MQKTGAGLLAPFIFIFPLVIQAAVTEREQAIALAMQTVAKIHPGEPLSVVKIRAVEWPDASLGCPKPGMLYAQVIVDGFHIVLAASNHLYTVHTGQGRATICRH